MGEKELDFVCLFFLFVEKQRKKTNGRGRVNQKKKIKKTRGGVGLSGTTAPHTLQNGHSVT